MTDERSRSHREGDPVSEAPRRELTIFKYELSIEGVCEIEVPYRSIPYHFSLDPYGALCVWMCIDPIETRAQTMRFKVVGTGQRYPGTGHCYIGTALDGPYEWHLFKVFEDSEEAEA